MSIKENVTKKTLFVLQYFYTNRNCQYFLHLEISPIFMHSSSVLALWPFHCCSNNHNINFQLMNGWVDEADFWTTATVSPILGSTAVLHKKTGWIEQLGKFLYGSFASPPPMLYTPAQISKKIHPHTHLSFCMYYTSTV